MADKYKIMSEATNGIFGEHELGITGLDSGIDAYLTETCLELLEYVNRKTISSDIDEFGQIQFQLKEGGHWVTREQLFKNFL